MHCALYYHLIYIAKKITFGTTLNLKNMSIDQNKPNSIYDCSIIELPRIENPAGNITPVHGNVNIPFDIARVYYLYDIPGGIKRGGHAHKALQQLIIAASGSFDVYLDDGINKKTN